MHDRHREGTMNPNSYSTLTGKPPGEEAPRAGTRTLRELLRSASWAQSMGEPALLRLEAGVIEKAVPAGGYVCHKGEPAEQWVGVIDGLVKISSVWTTGKTVTFTGVPPGGWLGEGSLLKHELRKYDVVALRDSRIAYMNRQTFQWLLDNCLTFNQYLLTQINERLGQFIAMVEHERLLEPDARVARSLAALFHPVLYPGLGKQLQISQEEVGFLAGVSRQRANQALKCLEEAGLLKIEYGGITILDVSGLRTYGG